MSYQGQKVWKLYNKYSIFKLCYPKIYLWDIKDHHVKKENFSIVAKTQSDRLTLRRLIGVPQEHFKFMFMDDVWKGTLPPQTEHLKFITSSVMSCISGQSSWQGMQLQSNQYCVLSLSYFEKITNMCNKLTFCSTLNSWIGEFVVLFFWCHEQVLCLSLRVEKINHNKYWKGMQLQSNQYCALSLSYFEKITNITNSLDVFGNVH